MAFPTKWVNGTGLTFKLGATQYEAEIAGFVEEVTTSGGGTIQMADGSIQPLPETTKVTAFTANVVQGLDVAAFFRYLRQTAPTTATVIVTGSTSATPTTTNPKWTYSVTGWAFPPLTFNPGQGDLVPVRFTVSGNPTEATA
jgi:hypothetical protein